MPLSKNDILILYYFRLSPSTSTFSGVPTLQSVEKQALPGQELPLGNYLLVTWDGLFHNGHLIQLGAYLTDSGKTIIQNIRPAIFGDVLDDELSKQITYTKPSANVSYKVQLFCEGHKIYVVYINVRNVNGYFFFKFANTCVNQFYFC